MSALRIKLPNRYKNSKPKGRRIHVVRSGAKKPKTPKPRRDSQIVKNDAIYDNTSSTSPIPQTDANLYSEGMTSDDERALKSLGNPRFTQAMQRRGEQEGVPDDVDDGVEYEYYNDDGFEEGYDEASSYDTSVESNVVERQPNNFNRPTRAEYNTNPQNTYQETDDEYDDEYGDNDDDEEIGGFREYDVAEDDEFFEDENVKAAEEIEKRTLLNKLNRAKEEGIELSKKRYTINTTLHELRLEWGRIVNEKKRNQTKRMFYQNLNMAASGINLATSSAAVPSMIRGKFTNFPEYMITRLEEYEGPIDELSDRYGGVTIGQFQDPMMNILVLFAWHMIGYLYDRWTASKLRNTGIDSDQAADMVQRAVEAGITRERIEWQNRMDEMQQKNKEDMYNLVNSLHLSQSRPLYQPQPNPTVNEAMSYGQPYTNAPHFNANLSNSFNPNNSSPARPQFNNMPANPLTDFNPSSLPPQSDEEFKRRMQQAVDDKKKRDDDIKRKMKGDVLNFNV